MIRALWQQVAQLSRWHASPVINAGLLLPAQVMLDTVEVVLALKGDTPAGHEHAEGLKQAVQEAAAGELQQQNP